MTNNPGCLAGVARIFGSSLSPKVENSASNKKEDVNKVVDVSQVSNCYPEHQDIPIIPVSPLVTNFKQLSEDEEIDYASKNILLSKPIPQKFKDECAANFGPEILSLVEKVVTVFSITPILHSAALIDTHECDRYIQEEEFSTLKIILLSAASPLGKKAGPFQSRAGIPKERPW